MKKLISFIIPTRKRFFSGLSGFLKSVINTVNDLSRIEVLLKFDSDDKESLKNIVNLPKEIDYKILISSRGGGWKDLHIWQNQLASLSDGTFLFVINDDTIIQSKDWDVELSKKENIVGMFQPEVDGLRNVMNVFPLIHRSIYETLGHLSVYPQTDVWLWTIDKVLGYPFRVPFFEMKIKHLVLEPDFPKSLKYIKTGNDNGIYKVPLEQDIEKMREFLNKKI